MKKRPEPKTFKLSPKLNLFTVQSGNTQVRWKTVPYIPGLKAEVLRHIGKGLWGFLNSTLVDKYFRQMNGHTQVNATDLRTLRYPTKEQLVNISRLISFEHFDQQRLEEIVNEVLLR